MKKIIILVSILFFYINSFADSLPPFRQGVYFEAMAMTQYKSPMIGIMLEQSVKDKKTDINFIIRGGLWVHPIIAKANFFVIQCGVSHPITKKLDAGVYFMNLNARLPKPVYAHDSLAKDYGYLSPFSLYLTAYPFKNKNLTVNPEISYFTNLNKLGFRVGIHYKILSRNTK